MGHFIDEGLRILTPEDKELLKVTPATTESLAKAAELGAALGDASYLEQVSPEIVYRGSTEGSPWDVVETVVIPAKEAKGRNV